jgi:hypothetical protein
MAFACPRNARKIHQGFWYFFGTSPAGIDMATRIDTVASRDRLKPRRGPYWHRLTKGCYVGCRRMTTSGHGSWLARARDEDAGVQQLYKPLGEFLDLADHQRFDAAAKAAQAWFDHLGRGGTARAATVLDACTRYVGHLKATKSERAAKDAEARFKNYVLNLVKLAATELPKLTPAQLSPLCAVRPGPGRGRIANSCSATRPGAGGLSYRPSVSYQS